MKKLLIACLSVIVLFVTGSLSGCNKNNDRTSLQIHLTDNPYNAQQVNIDLKQVNINLTDDSSGWQSVPTIAGVYNLLDFQNGIDTLVASANIPAGTLKEVRLVLGSDNSIMIDSVKYRMTIPSGSESGLKIKLNKALHAGNESLVIDFDAALSVHQVDEQHYSLRPVLRIK